MQYESNTFPPDSPEILQLDGSLNSMLLRNKFAVLSDLGKMFRVRHLKEGVYVRISTPGRLGLHYYSAPLHDVSVKVIQYGRNNGPDQYCVMFNVGNMDDMQWSAWSVYFDTKQEAIDLADKVAPILEDMLELPSEDELNEMLQPFGMFGQFE